MQDPEVMPGKVLVARKFWKNEMLNRSVILVLEHDETGSTGVILNKTRYVSQDSDGEHVRYGGDFDPHRLGFIHQLRNLSKTIRISDEVYYSENCEQLQNLLTGRGEQARRVKAFMGFTVWDAGRLEEEVKAGKWWVDEFKMMELHEADNTDLWEYKLLRAGRLYGIFAQMEDPGLN